MSPLDKKGELEKSDSATGGRILFNSFFSGIYMQHKCFCIHCPFRTVCAHTSSLDLLVTKSPLGPGRLSFQEKWTSGCTAHPPAPGRDKPLPWSTSASGFRGARGRDPELERPQTSWQTCRDVQAESTWHSTDPQSVQMDVFHFSISAFPLSPEFL